MSSRSVDSSPALGADGDGFSFAGQGEYSTEFDDADRNASPRRSVWRAVGFGRTKSPEVSGQNKGTWSRFHSGGSINSRTPPMLMTTGASPLLPSSPVRSPGSLSPSPGGSGGGRLGKDKWLFEAQSVNAAIQGAGGGVGRKASVVGLGLGEEDERKMEAQAGRTTDAEDTMDDDDEGEDDTVDVETATRWRSRRGETYTHDLKKGVQSEAEEEEPEEEDEEDAGSETEEESLLDGATEGAPKVVEAETPGESLFSRRRPLGTSPSGGALSSLGPTEDGVDGSAPRTAPLEGTTPKQSSSFVDADASRGRSWSDGDVSLAKGEVPEGSPEPDGLHALSGNMQNMSMSPDPGRAGPWPADHPGRSSVADYVVAIIGPRNAGKSTVINRGLKQHALENHTILISDDDGNRATSCTSTFKLAEQRRTLQILEIDSPLLQYNAQGIVWPRDFPACDGIMLCYDATDKGAYDPLEKLLRAFWERGSDIPLLVLACKAHVDPEQNAIDPRDVATMANLYQAGIVNFDGGPKDRKMKDTFKWIIRTMMENRGEPSRRTSSASVTSSSASHSARNSLSDSGAIRRSSTSPDATAVTFDNPFTSMGPPSRSGTGRIGALGLEVVQEAPVGEREQVISSAEIAPEDTSAPLPITPPPAAPAPIPFPTATPNELVPTPEKAGRKQSSTSLDLHFSREDMIDKFLFASVTGNDETYVNTFLIVYRRFARPYDVVSKLIGRFDYVAAKLKTDPLLSRFAQMKLCGVLATWFSYYPGDFSAPSTKGLLQPFLESLLPRGATWVAHYAVELLPILEDRTAAGDPELAWALPDKPSDNAPSAGAYLRRPSVAPSYDSTTSSQLDSHDGSRSRLSFPSSSGGQNDLSSTTSPPYSFDSRPRSASDVDSSGAISSSSSRRAKQTADSVLLDLSNALLELPEDVIAQQITRLAWKAFATMTPRDLLRHVLAPHDKNARSPHGSPSNVRQSIDFLNYLSSWVATMILIQSKLKWRARMLEKFIAIASSLRKLENFDSLMGVLMGINSQPVFRLTDTMEVISLKLEGDRTKLPKRLRSLNKLMAMTKSFSAYRLAVATSGAEMLPYLGVHLQEITLTNEVKSDMKDGKVNWTKFSQMGRSASIVLECSRQPVVFETDKTVERCILNVPLLSTERQYELSYEYQPRKAGQDGSMSSRIRFKKVFAKVGDTLNSNS
ncbi:RAS guanyl-releasing protein 1 [Pseudohyphozyma bogoriensis]|nr:RAS guanyl-releasing protein 1 [Pseudohyphozyma bogoriensis]